MGIYSSSTITASKCSSKVGHTRLTARTEVERLIGIGESGLRIYKCDFCRCWHVGHKVIRGSFRYSTGEIGNSYKGGVWNHHSSV